MKTSLAAMVGTVCAVMVLFAGCRSSEELSAQEADARVRTCVSLIERGIGWAVAAERKIEEPRRPGADWRLLVDQPDEYYKRLVDVVTIPSYIEVAEEGRTFGTFRTNSREMKAGCPLPGSPWP